MKKEDQLKLTSSLQSILKKIEELHETIQVINKRTDYDNDDEEMDDDELLCNLIDYLVEAEETIESAICRVEPFYFVEN
jgi:predicted transcriptional regulator